MVTHRAMNTSTAENFMRSAKAPTIRAGVMAAKVSWNMANTSSGITTPLLKVSTTESPVMPLRNILSRPPMKLFRPPPGVKARL